MKSNLDCIPCFQRQALQAVRFITADEGVQEKVLHRVLSELQQIPWDQTPPQIARIVYSIVREETGEQDPYSHVKRQYNDLGLNLYDSMKKSINEADDPLFRAVQLAIAGNIVDFGPNSDINLMSTISRVLTTPLKINHFEKFKATLAQAQTLLYLADNTGEIVFDRLLLETILNSYKLRKIRFAVKGAPIINDATVEDAIYVGINQIPNLEFVEIGIGVPGTGIEREDEAFYDLLQESDIIISKGQGNYEALSSENSIFFMLLAKCPVVARDLGVEVGDIILKGA